MTFNINRVKVCPNCGALLHPDMEREHARFHQAVLDLAEVLQSVNDQTLALTRTTKDLATVVKDHLKVTLGQVTS